MNKEELLSAIAKTNKVIGNDTMPEAVKEVARNTKAKLEAQLAELEKGATPEPKKEEPKKEEPKKEEPKKEKPQYKKKIVEKKIIMPKKETPKDNQKEAEKSMEGKKLTVENCRELLAKLKTKRESAKKRLETRKKQGKPAELTTIEALTSASATLEKKVEKEVEKKGQLPKSTLKRSTKEVVDIVATIISGIPTKAERTSYINEVIADLKKLIDKVEPITEKMERGGYMADGGLIEIKDGGRSSQGDYQIRLTYNPKTKLSDMSITEESKNALKVTSFKKIPYGVVEGFARKLQDFKDEFDNDLTTNNWDFSSRYASADTDMMEYGANRSGNSYVIFIGDKTKSFYSDSLMDSIANAFIELHENLSDKYARGGYMAKGGKLIATSPSLESMTNLINKYFYSTSYYLEPKNDKEYSVFNKKGLNPNYIVVKKADRYRFEEASSMFAKGGYMEHGGMLDEETKYKINNGFLKRDMNEILNRLLPYNFGFKVFKPSPRPNELTPNYDDAPSSLYGYDDKDIKSKLYFPQYKRDHDINFKITQGGENTYFDFYLNDSEGNEWIGTFGFKDKGDVDSTYITKFIAFLMECYGLPFQVNHSVMQHGGIVKNINEDLVRINAKLKRLEEFNSEDAYRETEMLRKQKSALEALLLHYNDEPKNTEIMYKAPQHYPKR